MDEKEWSKSDKRTLDIVLIEIQELEFLNRALKMQMTKNDNKIQELEKEMVKLSFIAPAYTSEDKNNEG